jgi:two-component sensor histidine kinase
VFAVPLLRPLEYMHHHTLGLPWPVRYGATLGMVGAAWGVRYGVGGWLNDGAIPFTFFYPAILCAAACFANGAGYLAATAAAGASIYYLPPVGVWAVPQGSGMVALCMFWACGLLTACTVETLHHAVRLQRAALAEVVEATRRRVLLLTEYRHRMRGDLQGVASLLRLRARHVEDPAGKRALHEAAAHTVALGRIHTRLERARHDRDETAVVDTREFVEGVCADMVPPIVGAGAVQREISTDRGLALGLLVNELVAEARQDGGEHVAVRLAEAGGDFILDVIDDRPGRAEPDVVRGRLIGLLAAQLRGQVTRTPNRAGPGLAVAVRFPVLAPVLAPGRVGL